MGYVFAMDSTYGPTAVSLLVLFFCRYGKFSLQDFLMFFVFFILQYQNNIVSFHWNILDINMA